MYLSLTLHQCDYKKAKSQVQTKQRSWGLDAKRDEWPLTWQTVKIWIWSSLSRSKRLAAQESGKKAKEPGCNWSSKKKKSVVWVESQVKATGWKRVGTFPCTSSTSIFWEWPSTHSSEVRLWEGDTELLGVIATVTVEKTSAIQTTDGLNRNLCNNSKCCKCPSPAEPKDSSSCV